MTALMTDITSGLRLGGEDNQEDGKHKMELTACHVQGRIHRMTLDWSQLVGVHQAV